MTLDVSPETGIGSRWAEPEDRRAATRNPYSPVMLVATLAATVGVIAYGWFLLNPENRGDLLPWAIVIFAEIVLVFHAVHHHEPFTAAGRRQWDAPQLDTGL